MVNVSEELRDEFLSDRSHKDLCITVDDEPGNITNINWYIWDFRRTGPDSVALYSFFTAWHDEINQQYLRYADYLYLSCRVKFNGDRSALDGKYLRIRTINTTVNAYIISLNESASNKWAIDAFMDGTLRLYCRIDKEYIADFCHRGDPEYGGSYPTAWVQLYNNMGGADVSVDQVQLQCEYKNYTFDELYPTSNRTNYKLPYLGYNSFASNDTIAAIVRRPADHIDPIYNDKIAAESMTLSESICSKDTLKIGSSEASVFKISLINRLERFNGRYIRPYISTKEFTRNPVAFEYGEINWIKGIAGGYLPNKDDYWLRWRNSNPSIRKSFTSDYIGTINMSHAHDAKYVALKYKFKVTQFSSADVSPAYINAGAKIDSADISYYVGDHFNFEDAQTDFQTYSIIFGTGIYGGLVNIPALVFLVEDSNKEAFSSGTMTIQITIKEIQVLFTDTKVFPEYDTDACIEWRGIDVERYIFDRQRCLIDKYEEPAEYIPLGRFLIADSTIKNAITYKRNELVGYDDIYNLSVSAANWYKMHMFAISLDGYTGGGYEYTRQMYSTYWNILSALMLESRKKHKEELIFSEVTPHYKNSTTPKPGGGYYGAIAKSWEVGADDPQGWFFEHLWYGEVNVTVSEQAEDFLKHPLVFDIWYSYALNYHYGAQQNYHYVYSSYRNFVDPYGRGIYNRAAILVNETLQDGTHNKFCVDNGDYFMLSPDCVSVSIYYPCAQYPHADNAGTYMFLNGTEDRPGVQLHSVVDLSPDFVNASARLVYYNYNTREISDSNSNLTAREVVSSLLEINGCFLDSDRYGVLKPVYVSKEGLYPAENLYPNDDPENGPVLYPNEVELTLPTASYIKTDYADYITKEFGKIQIRKMNALSNEDENVVQWEYVGDVEYLNTYVIDDNVFFSGNNIVYSKENMPEVDKMLERMWEKILVLSYTPNYTEAVGLPWIEAGDRINLVTNKGGYESFIFRRTLSGIQILKDTYEAYGDEVEPSIDNYSVDTYKDTPIAPYHT